MSKDDKNHRRAQLLLEYLTLKKLYSIYVAEAPKGTPDSFEARRIV